ncbi:MAG: ATP-binding cassette domain-containing protein [Clostridium fessum]
MAAGEKFEQEYYIPLGVRADQMFVSVQDVNGKTVIRKRLKLGSEEDVAESYIGILTDTPEALSYLDGAGIRYGTLRTRAVFLDAEQAPDDRLGYDPLDLVIVSGFDLDSLSDVQYEALRRWVEDGGTILFGGGVDCARNYGRFAEKVLEPPYLDAVTVPVSLGGETAPGEQTGEIQAECVDVNLKNGSTLLAGEVFPLLSHTNCKRGRIVAAAFSMDAISDLCLTNPSSFEKLYTLVLGSDTVDELAQEDYYGYSGSYFSVQGLVNTGNAGRLPKVAAYTVIVVVYLLLIGPGIYFYLKKRGIYRYYLPAVTLGAFLFTGIIYALGVKTRFREPFVTYASILDTSGEEAEEATYMNIRSPYNKPYSVSLKPGYEVRPMTRSYYYDAVSAVRFTGEEEYHTNFVYQPERVEIKMRDTVAFSPNLFTLRRELEKTDAMGVQGNISYFDGVVSGTVKNCFEEPLENAALLINGKAVLLGRLEPGQTVSLDGKESCNYPVSYSYAAAQMVTGADQYEKAEIEDPDYLKAQERTRLLSFYLDSGAGRNPSEACLVAFSTRKLQGEEDFLADARTLREGFCMVTESIPLNREKDGKLYRSALEEDPTVLAGNYEAAYNTMYSGETAEAATVEYSLGSDLVIEKLTFETLSPRFSENPLYPYMSSFSGSMYFYNYETGRNDRIELKSEYSAKELSPYLSPSNTLTVKYVPEQTGEYGWESQLPRIYVVGRREVMLTIKNLRKRYGNFQALDGLNLEVADGELFGFVGPNGAGKTTTLKILAGLLVPDEGEVEIGGLDVYSDGKELRRRIGYVPDFFGVYDNLKVSEYMEFFASCYGITGLQARTRCHTLLEQVRLEDKEDFFVDGLSRGMKQRLCLARALIHDPDLLILDEPASGLDPRTRVEYTAILKELRDQGKTLLVSSHILSELSELCTSIGIIEQGRTVLQGSMDQIFARINSSNPLLISIFSQKEKALAILKSHPCVQTIAVQGDEIKLGFLGDRQDEALLLQQLIDADVMVSSFMREKGSLESLFMQITGHEEERAVLKHEMESGI